jgi:hypothetical protein
VRRWAPAASGALAALLWLLLGLRWFDAAERWRPAAVQAVPPALLAALLAAALGAWLWPSRRALLGPAEEGPGLDATARRLLWLAVAVAVAFRLPLAIQGAAGYLTPDGALSGIVALRVHEGSQRLVFVPQVAYSGSLKSHLAAALMAVLDPPRAFAVASVLFYAVFVAALFRLGWAAARADRRWTATAAAFYVAFAPAFVTRYSLSNDGNYVEVLALGTLALLAALRWRQAPHAPGPAAVAIGLLLGLAFWSHVLALVHVLAIGGWMLATAPGRAVRALPRIALGFVLGVWPSLVWNAGHGWETLRYLVPGGDTTELGGRPFASRLSEVFTGQWPVLLGYDPGNPRVIDVMLRVAAVAAAAALVWAVVTALRERPRDPAVLLLLALLASNLALALAALPVIDGNPRYLLFAMAAVPVLLARVLEPRRRRWALAALVAVGAAGSLLQAPGALRADAQWRGFVADLEAAGVRFCHTDFYLATKVNFLSGERVICSAKLGPTTTEYFVEYRRRAEAAPEAALVAVNATNAEKLERRLQRAGITYERRDLMKPVLLNFSRPVDPALLFPGREFPLR